MTGDGRYRIEPRLAWKALLEVREGRSFDLLLGRRNRMTSGPTSGRRFRKQSGGGWAGTPQRKCVATHRPDSLGWGPVKDLGADIIEGISGITSEGGPST